jgi:hypothetical protein
LGIEVSDPHIAKQLFQNMISRKKELKNKKPKKKEKTVGQMMKERKTGLKRTTKLSTKM